MRLTIVVCCLLSLSACQDQIAEERRANNFRDTFLSEKVYSYYFSDYPDEPTYSFTAELKGDTTIGLRSYFQYTSLKTSNSLDEKRFHIYDYYRNENEKVYQFLPYYETEILFIDDELHVGKKWENAFIYFDSYFNKNIADTITFQVVDYHKAFELNNRAYSDVFEIKETDAVQKNKLFHLDTPTYYYSKNHGIIKAILPPWYAISYVRTTFEVAEK